MEWSDKQSRIQRLDLEVFASAGLHVDILREDLLDPEISGNKYRKLKYNVLKAKDSGHDTMLTFGGAFSNHIAAVAAAGERFGFRTIGVIRGEEHPDNPTLLRCREQGMELYFVSRSDYRLKNAPEFKEHLIERYGNFHLIPEGGANYNGVNGCMEILQSIDEKYDAVVAACGTGTMLAGLILSAKADVTVYGVSALKGNFMRQEVLNRLEEFLMNKEAITDYEDSFAIWNDYHRGGYAKIDDELVKFIWSVKEQTGIPLDAVYTGKTAMALVHKASTGFFKEGARVLMIHSGGVQGNKGMSHRTGISLPVD
jgi:1-aminocyclopropane-1-carboxylate deaminase